MRFLSFPRGAIVVIAFLAAFATAAHVFARQGDPDLKRRLEALENAQRSMVKDLQEIKAMLQGRGAPPPQAPAQAPLAGQGPELDQVISIAGRPLKGRSEAKLVIVEFSDFQCPFCGKYSRETYPQVMKEFVETGRAQYAYLHFPLERLHPNAMNAAQAAECAFGQGKFWEMHDRLFANQNALGLPQLALYQQGLGMNPTTLKNCIGSAQVVARIKADLDLGARAGMTGTPGFFIGQMLKGGQVRLLRRFKGAVPLTTFKAMIDAVAALPLAK